MAGTISMGARREVLAVVAKRYRAVGRREKGRIIDELCATTGWHRKHALRALSRSGSNALTEERAARRRGRKYEAIKDALIALWETSDRVCSKRLAVMMPTLLPALERHGRLRLGEIEGALVLSVSAATIDRLLGDVKVCDDTIDATGVSSGVTLYGLGGADHLTRGSGSDTIYFGSADTIHGGAGVDSVAVYYTETGAVSGSMQWQSLQDDVEALAIFMRIGRTNVEPEVLLLRPLDDGINAQHLCHDATPPLPDPSQDDRGAWHRLARSPRSSGPTLPPRPRTSHGERGHPLRASRARAHRCVRADLSGRDSPDQRYRLLAA